MSKHYTIPPRDKWTKLDGDELLKYLKLHKLTPASSTVPKQLFHEDFKTHEILPCKVVGYVSSNSAVIDIQGMLSCIDPSYLKEMQSKVLPTEHRFCVVDVETPNRKHDRICAIGITMIENDDISNTEYYLVNPEVNFSIQNSEINGLTYSDVANAPTFPKIWKELQPFFKNSIIVAHNAYFDLSVLSKTLSFYGLPTEKVSFLDTLSLTRSAFPDLPKHSLDALCRVFNIPLEHHHANSDCEACAKILLKIAHSGFNIEEHFDTYDLKQRTFLKKINNRPDISSHNICSETTSALNELSALLRSVTSDNILTLQEVSDISNWLDSHFELAGNYPFDRVFSALHTALAAGVLDQSTLDELFSLFKSVVDPISQITECTEPISIFGKTVCLTGDFESMSRAEVENELLNLGAILKKSVTKALDYLVVGGRGSSMWSAGNYGTKVKKALENQLKGSHVQIIREADLLASLTKDLTDDFQNESESKLLCNEIKSLLNQPDSNYDTSVIEFKKYCNSETDGAITFFDKPCFSVKGKKIVYLYIAPVFQKYFKSLNLQSVAATPWKRVELNSIVISDYTSALVEIYEKCWLDSSEQFGCCSRYQECSKSMKCTQPDHELKGGCQYRQKLREGINFYK